MPNDISSGSLHYIAVNPEYRDYCCVHAEVLTTTIPRPYLNDIMPHITYKAGYGHRMCVTCVSDSVCCSISQRIRYEVLYSKWQMVCEWNGISYERLKPFYIYENLRCKNEFAMLTMRVHAPDTFARCVCVCAVHTPASASILHNMDGHKDSMMADIMMASYQICG